MKRYTEQFKIYPSDELDIKTLRDNVQKILGSSSIRSIIKKSETYDLDKEEMNQSRGPVGHRKFLLVELYLDEYYLPNRSRIEHITEDSKNLKEVFDDAGVDVGLSIKANSTMPVYPVEE